MSLFDSNGNPTREFLDSDAYYDDPPATAPRVPCGPCRVCGRTNERFTIWAERDLCVDCDAAGEAFDADGTLLEFVRRCRVCGCTDQRACRTAEGPCHWVAADLCSACDTPPLLYGPDGGPLVAA